MKKYTIIASAVIFAIFSLISCESGPFSPAAGSAQADDMLRLLPKDVNAVFFIDVQGILTIEAVNTLITEKTEEEKFEEATDFQKFTEMTGINIQKDIYFIAAALKQGNEKYDGWGVGIVNLKYDKDRLLSFIIAKSEEGSELIEEDYNGFTLYTVKEKDKESSFGFIDDLNIVAGNVDIVKSVINVLQKKEESVLNNGDFSVLFKDTDKGALFWGGIIVPPEVSSKLAEEMPMAGSIEAVQAVSLSFDYRDRIIMAEIKLISSDPVKNQEMADSLIGLKGMGAMIQIQDFNFGEVLDRIEITSAPDHVRIFASYPDDFFNDFMSKFALKNTEEKK